MVQRVPYGRWWSPLAPQDVAVGRLSLSEIQSDDDAIYWLESRPAENGRVVFVRSSEGRRTDHSPDGVSVRSRVHEYGGGAVTLIPTTDRVVASTGAAFAYVDQVDQRVWFCAGAGAAHRPRPLTPAPPSGHRWNHGGLSASADGAWVLAVREDHADSDAGPRRSIVALATNAATSAATNADADTDTDPPDGSTLLSGHDFYGTARLDHAADRLTATAWDHPNMPWDASSVLVVNLEHHADPESGHARLQPAAPPVTVAGATNEESVGQPAWRADGSLRFISDRRGWWQPYFVDVPPGPQIDEEAAQPFTTYDVEFHGPDWALGQRTMADLLDGRLVARATRNGCDYLVLLPDSPDAPVMPYVIDQPCTSISAVCRHGDGVAYIGSTPDSPATIYVLDAIDPTAPIAATPIPPPPPTSTSTTPTLRTTDIAKGGPITFTGRTGRPVHATFYRPTLTDTAGPRHQAPPLIVICHSGPTGAAATGYDAAVQFFTTRGFAVATPDYAGSTGYGRDYRRALDGQWGVADSEDCLDTARHLAAAGEVDATRMAARGSSAGGFTALNALAAGEGFAACASWYGVTDLRTLAASTHDFEAHYNDRLVGPLPEAAELYDTRSPLSRAADMRGAVLLLQGDEDPVVPLLQAQALHDALRAAGRICELHIFGGEGHGFRRADTLQSAFELELAFYLTHLRL